MPERDHSGGGDRTRIPGSAPEASYASRLSARSALYTDLGILLDGRGVALESKEYRTLVVDQNCLGRASASVPVPEMGGKAIIAEGGLAPGSVYTIGTDAADNRLALILLRTQMNRGSGRIAPLGSLSGRMKESIKTADAYLKANLKNLGDDHDLKAYDFTVQAINLNQAKEGAETAVAFFISFVSCLLAKPVQDQTVVLGGMSIHGTLLKVGSLPERMQLAVEAGAKRILIPGENKRDLADVPDEILTAVQWHFCDSPSRAAILAMDLG